MKCRADSRLAHSQWEKSLQSNSVSHRLSATLESVLNYPNPRYIISWRTQHENIPNTHVSAYCRQSLRSTFTCINMKTVRLYFQTAINFQRKCLGTPDCKNVENVLIDFIWLNVQAKYLIQTILYHFKSDMALWKWPKCPQYMQRTRWQTVATQHTELT